MSLWTDLLGGASAVAVTASATHAVTTSASGSGKNVVIFAGNTLPTAVSVTDSHSNTWTLGVEKLVSGRWIAAFYFDGTLPSGTVITCTLTGASPTHWAAAAYTNSGVASGAPDFTAFGSQTATHPPSVSFTTVSANDEILGASFVTGAETFTADSGWTQDGYASSGTTHAIYVEEEKQVSAGAGTYAPTISDTSNGVTSIVLGWAQTSSPQTLLVGKVATSVAVRGVNLNQTVHLGKVATGVTVRGANLAGSGAVTFPIGHVSTGVTVRGANLAGSGHGTLLVGHVATGVTVRGVNLVPGPRTMPVGHIASGVTVRGANLTPGPVTMPVGHVASSVAVRGVNLNQTVHVGKIVNSIAFSTRRGVTYMKRNATLANGSDSTMDATITAPWISGVSLYLRWFQFEATRGTFTWDSVGASALEAKTNNRKLILRISCGNDAPSHVYSDFGGPNGGVTKVTLNSGAYIQPAVWEAAWRTEYARLYAAVNALLNTALTDGSGEKIGDYCIGVTIGSASQDNPEMASCTQWKAAGNAPAIKAALDGTTAAMDGLSGKGGQSTYALRMIQLLADAWEWGLKWHRDNVFLCGSIFAFGTLACLNDSGSGTTNDSDVNQQAFAGNYFGGANAGRLIGLITNYYPNQSPVGVAVPGAPYEQNRTNGEHTSIQILRQVGGAYGFQFDPSSMNAMTDPSPGNSLALMLYSGATLAGDGLFYRGNVPSYYDDVRFVEVGAGLFGKNDTELQNAITAMRRTPSPYVRGVYLSNSVTTLTLSVGKVTSGQAVRGANLAGAGAVTLSVGKVASGQAVRGANLAPGPVTQPVGKVASTQRVYGVQLQALGTPLLIGKIASSAVVRGANLAGVGAAPLGAGHLASGAVVRGANLRGAGAVVLQAGHVSTSVTVRGVTLTPGPVAFPVGKVAHTPTVRGANLTPGPVSLITGKVAHTSTVHGVTLAPAGAAHVLAGKIASTATVYGVRVVLVGVPVATLGGVEGYAGSVGAPGGTGGTVGGQEGTGSGVGNQEGFTGTVGAVGGFGGQL